VLKNGVGRYNIFFNFYTKLAESSFLCRFRVEYVNVLVCAMCFFFEKNIIKTTQVLSIICNTICLQFSLYRALCRVCVCFHLFHHVFPILSVILTKYHYIILTNYPGSNFMDIFLNKKLRCNSTVKIRFGRKKILNYAYVLKNGVGRYNIFFNFYTKLADSSEFGFVFIDFITYFWF
jgi:hypothetical protein